MSRGVYWISAFTARLLNHPERGPGLAAEVRVDRLILTRDRKALAAPSKGWQQFAFLLIDKPPTFVKLGNPI